MFNIVPHDFLNLNPIPHFTGITEVANVVTKFRILPLSALFTVMLPSNIGYNTVITVIFGLRKNWWVMNLLAVSFSNQN